jgi:predicted DNA-binding ribbon-helix-helix protein
MRTVLSERRRRFYSLVRQAHYQPTSWLIAVLQDKSRNNGWMSALARLACLRILASRNMSGQPYPQRKKLVRQEIGI